jgi:hypothetical protein
MRLTRAHTSSYEEGSASYEECIPKHMYTVECLQQPALKRQGTALLNRFRGVTA